MPPRPKRLRSSMIKRTSRKTLPTQASKTATAARAKTLNRATKGTGRGLAARGVAGAVTPGGAVGKRLSRGEAPKIAKKPVGKIPNSRFRGSTLPATAKKPVTPMRGQAPPMPKTPPSGIGAALGSNKQSVTSGLRTPRAVRGPAPGEQLKATRNITKNRSRSTGNKRR